MNKSARLLEDLNRLDMENHFRERTLHHITLVQKYLERMILLNDPRLDVAILTAEMNHDRSKFEYPEYEPYLHIDWGYYMKSQGKEYNPPEDIDKQMKIASSHHVFGNPHHPEYWSKPESRSSIIDATSMPLSYVASMCADWLAMSEELNNSAIDWADKNIGKKWIFTDTQKEFIYFLLNKLGIS